MDNKQTEKIIKEKFNTKLELKKLQGKFVNNLQDLQKHRQDLISKNKELKATILKKKIVAKESTKREKIKYQEEIKKHKQEILNEKKSLTEEKIKFAEIIKLEKQEHQQNSLKQISKRNKVIQETKEINQKLIFENKKTLSNLKLENKKDLVKQKQTKQKQKLRFSVQKEAHMNEVFNYKKEILDLKKRHIINKEKAFADLMEVKNKARSENFKLKMDIEKAINKEKRKYKLDALRIKKDRVEYSIVLKERKAKEKEAAAKIVLETKELESKEKIETIQAIEAPAVVENTFNNETNYKSTIEKNQSINNTIDMSNPVIRGVVISEAGKKAFKFFNKINSKENPVSLTKIKITQEEKDLLKKARDLKSKNNLVPIENFVHYAAFLNNVEMDDNKILGIIISIIFNMVNKNKTFAFLGGYFSIIKIRGIKKIVYSHGKLNLSRSSIINLPESKVAKDFENIISKKLNNKQIIRISENIFLTKQEGDIKVITDVAFMR